MKSRERDFSVRENELQDKLDKVSRKFFFIVLLDAICACFLNSLPGNTLSYCSSQAFRQTQEATEMLKRTREEKIRYEEELMTIKRKTGVQEALRQRLSDSEVVQYKHLTSVHFIDLWVYLRN